MRLRVRTYISACFVAGVLGLVACKSPSEKEAWRLSPVLKGERLDSLHTAELDLFVREGGHRYRAEFFLLHDNRTEEEAIVLNISLIGKHDTIYQGDQHIILAHKPGEWIGKGLLQHEVEFSLPQPISIRYPGIYKFKIYSPSNPSPHGIGLIGCRLFQIS